MLHKSFGVPIDSDLSRSLYLQQRQREAGRGFSKMLGRLKALSSERRNDDEGHQILLLFKNTTVDVSTSVNSEQI
jgi:hypothetical protein